MPCNINAAEPSSSQHRRMSGPSGMALSNAFAAAQEPSITAAAENWYQPLGPHERHGVLIATSSLGG